MAGYSSLKRHIELLKCPCGIKNNSPWDALDTHRRKGLAYLCLVFDERIHCADGSIFRQLSIEVDVTLAFAESDHALHVLGQVIGVGA